MKMQIIAMFAIAVAAFLFLGVYFLIDHIITGKRLKINQKAWDEYSANMDFNRKLNEYLPWCREQKIKNGWKFYYFPRM
ncbi:hypothetical protein [Agathobacter sp.]